MSRQSASTLRRLYLSPYETTPTYRNVHNKFSVSYLLNLVLVDEEDRRYFKQQEIVLYRLADSAQVRSDDHRSVPRKLALSSQRSQREVTAMTSKL